MTFPRFAAIPVPMPADVKALLIKHSGWGRGPAVNGFEILKITNPRLADELAQYTLPAFWHPATKLPPTLLKGLPTQSSVATFLSHVHGHDNWID